MAAEVAVPEVTQPSDKKPEQWSLGVREARVQEAGLEDWQGSTAVKRRLRRRPMRLCGMRVDEEQRKDTGGVAGGVLSRMHVEAADDVCGHKKSRRSGTQEGRLDNASRLQGHVTACLRPNSRRRRSTSVSSGPAASQISSVNRRHRESR